MEPIIVVSDFTNEDPIPTRRALRQIEPSTLGLQRAILKNPEVFRLDVYGFDAVPCQVMAEK